MYSSYKSLFKIQWHIYNIGEYALPRPIPLDTLGIFILLAPLGILISEPIANLVNQPRFAIGLLLSAALTYLITKFDPQGRPFFLFVYDLLVFFLRSKRYDFSLKPVAEHRKIKAYWQAIIMH